MLLYNYKLAFLVRDLLNSANIAVFHNADGKQKRICMYKHNFYLENDNV